MIRNIYKIKNQFYFLIQNFQNLRSFTKNLDIEEKLNEFFSISSLITNYSLINIHNIREKCIYLENNNEYFISICHSEEDHD